MSGSSSNSPSFKKVDGGIEYTVSAPGKVILHGEHSVVYGKLAVAASLGLRTRIHLVEIDLSDTIIVKLLPINCEHTFKLSDIEHQLLVDKPPSYIEDFSEFSWESPKLTNHEAHLEIIEKAVTSFLGVKNGHLLDITISKALTCLFYLLSGILISTKVDLKPMCISIDSELSMGAGTGSSASLSVALSAIFIRYLKLKTLQLKNISKLDYKRFVWSKQDPETETHFSERELEAISDWAFCGEKIFHGTPSGLDNTICTYGNLVKFRKNHSPNYLTLKTPIRLLLINTKVPRQTLKMVGHVAQLKSTFPNIVEHILNALDDVTDKALEVIQDIENNFGPGDDSLEIHFELWQTLIQINHNLLCSLGVSHPKLEEINMILDRHGFKGKLTGAGGGGFAISVLSPSNDPEEVVRILKEHSFEVIDTQLGGQGVRVDPY